MTHITEGQANEARKLLSAYEKQQKQHLYDNEKAERERLERDLAPLVMTPALETFLLTISEKEHDALRVTVVPRDEHIQRIKRRNLTLLMQAANKIAFYYNVEPIAFLNMMAELPTKPECAFDYRSWHQKLREYQKTA